VRKRISCLRIDCRLNGAGAYILVYNYVIGVERALGRAPGEGSCLVLATHCRKVRPDILLRLSSPDTTRPWPPRGGTCMVFVLFGDCPMFGAGLQYCGDRPINIPVYANDSVSFHMRHDLGLTRTQRRTAG
jgi:hypothetical protein